MVLETRDTTIPVHIVDIWQGVVNVAARLLGVPSVMINRLCPPELEVFRSNSGEENPFHNGMRMKMQGVYCESAALTRNKVRVVDARKDPVWADSPTARAGIFAYLGYPLFWPDGKVFGTICAVDTEENQWDSLSDDFLCTLKHAIEAHLALAGSLDELTRRNTELSQALTEVSSLKGLLPICSSCKKIRDDKGYWNQLEAYFARHSSVEFSHGICPECASLYYPEIEEYQKRKK